MRIERQRRPGHPGPGVPVPVLAVQQELSRRVRSRSGRAVNPLARSVVRDVVQLTGAARSWSTTTKSSSGSLRTYLITRLLLVIPMVWVLVTLVFFVMRVIGDPIESAFGGRLPADEIASRRHSAGLDRPLLSQYWDYLVGVLHGDFGTR